MADRYEGKPFLRLLECYVLESIGELEQSQRDLLAKMEPKLRQIYHDEGGWFQIVARQMRFSQDFAEQIKKVWEQNRTAAKNNGENLLPADFAQIFIDQNFPEITADPRT